MPEPIAAAVLRLSPPVVVVVAAGLQPNPRPLRSHPATRRLWFCSSGLLPSAQERGVRYSRRVVSLASRLRIAVFTLGEGRDRLLNGLIDYSDPQRVSFEVVALESHSGPLMEDMQRRGVPLHRMALRPSVPGCLPPAVLRLRGLLKVIRPDVIHSLLFIPGLVCELARGSLTKPPASILARHHNLMHHLLRRPLHVKLDRWSAIRASHVVAVSSAVKTTLVEREGVPAGHVTVIHNGLDWERTVRADPAQVASLRARFAPGPLLVAAGRLDVQKDYPTLLRAFARITARYPSATLAIAGTGAPRCLASLRRLASQLGVGTAVTFLGWVPQVYDLIAAADLFVQASIDEAFGQTLAEAIGLGVPVATTTPGSVLEVTGQSERVPSGDPELLARYMLSQLAAHPERVAEHKAAARARVRQQFGAAAMANAYVTLYERCAVRASSHGTLFKSRSSTPPAQLDPSVLE